MKSVKKILLLLSFFISAITVAQIPERPNPPKLVNDGLGLLTPSQQEKLETKLVEFDKKTSTQIAIYTTNNIASMDAGDFATEVLRKWGIGSKTNNNGVLVLIYRSQDNTKRKVFITTGYGVEGVLPDYTCSEIVNNEIIPLLKGQDYYGALENGTNAIIKATQGAYTAPPGYYTPKGPSVFKILFLIIVVIIILSIISKGGGGGRYMSRRGYRGFDGPTIWWTGGGSSSGGGGWSGGGGGFGGFGGGSGGGGGAGGDW